MTAAPGRLVGVLSAIGVIALWAVFLFRNPYAPMAGGGTLLIGCTMMLAAAMSAAAAASGAYLGMYLLFFVMFVPIGFYVWMTPGIFRFIGWLEIVYLAGAVLVHRQIMTSKRKRAG